MPESNGQHAGKGKNAACLSPTPIFADEEVSVASKSPLWQRLYAAKVSASNLLPATSLRLG